jgi:hypothetical protein
MKKIALLLAVLVPFLVYSVFVVETEGYFGFITLALRERWGMQVLVDLAISMTLFNVWMVPDAKKRGIAAWPYIALSVAFGSIGALGYLVHRSVKQLSAREADAARSPAAG